MTGTGLAPHAVALVPARVDHLDQVAALWHAAWQDAHLGNVPDALLPHRRPADVRRLAAARLEAMTVAVDRAVTDGPVVGFHVVTGDEVEQLYVSAHWRGTGVAAALLDHAERVIARDHGRARLVVAPGNARARRFYERRGWHDTGAFDNPAEAGDGVVLVPTRLYVKALGGP